jgi:hypothetical protein
VRNVFADRKTRILNPRNWADQLRDVFEVPESAPRVAEFKARADEIGWEEGTRMSEGQALQLLLDSKRVTTDFTSQGQMTKVLNRIMPFTTAQIGGQRALVRAFQQNPTRALAAAMTIAAGTLGYWWARKDEDWYNDLLPRHRFNNWYFPVGEDGPVFVLPRPFEWGSLFGSVPEALAHAWYQDDPEHAQEVMGHLHKNLNPLGTTQIWGTDVPAGMPAAIEPLAEQIAGEGGTQFYFDRPIVPRGEVRKPPAEQFGPYTSGLAKKVGEVYGVSPRRLEHLIAGYFGGVGRDALHAMDGLASTLGLVQASGPPVERERTAADIPAFGKLFRPGGRPGTQSEAVNRMYEILEKRQMVQASDRRDETETERQARLLLQDAQKAISVLSWLQNHTPEAGRRRELQVQIRETATDVTSTVEEGLGAIRRKRAQLQALKRLDEHTERLGPDRAEPLIDRSLDALQRGRDSGTTEPTPTP